MAQDEKFDAEIEGSSTEGSSRPVGLSPEVAERMAKWGSDSSLDLHLEGEIWKPLREYGNKNYRGVYAVSNYGRVKSFRRRGRPTLGQEVDGSTTLDGYEGHLVSSGPQTSSGHLVVNIGCDGKYAAVHVARLVLCVFVADPLPGMIVYFKDGERTHVWLSNLTWGPRRGVGLTEVEHEWLGEQATQKLEDVVSLLRKRDDQITALREQLQGAGVAALRERWLEIEEKLEPLGEKPLPVNSIVAKIGQSLWRK
jgi:hypothetical protein